MSDQAAAWIIFGVFLAILALPFIWLRGVDTICGKDGFDW